MGNLTFSAQHIKSQVLGKGWGIVEIGFDIIAFYSLDHAASLYQRGIYIIKKKLNIYNIINPDAM